MTWVSASLHTTGPLFLLGWKLISVRFFVHRVCSLINYPRHSMYGIFTDIWLFLPNVGKYTIQWASGYGKPSSTKTVVTFCELLLFPEEIADCVEENSPKGFLWLSSGLYVWNWYTFGRLTWNVIMEVWKISFLSSFILIIYRDYEMVLPVKPVFFMEWAPRFTWMFVLCIWSYTQFGHLVIWGGKGNLETTSENAFLTFFNAVC